MSNADISLQTGKARAPISSLLVVVVKKKQKNKTPTISHLLQGVWMQQSFYILTIYYVEQPVKYA